MKGKVVLVRFPFDDLSSSKVRPAVCLTEAIGEHRHVVVAFLTSRIPAELLGSDVIFRPEDPDFSITGLRVASTLRLHRLMTVTRDLVLRELGTLSPERRKIVEQKLVWLFSSSAADLLAASSSEQSPGDGDISPKA